MQATVDIHTGHKTAIDYLIKPVIKSSTSAFELSQHDSSDSARARRPIIH
jgi:hypothetical protein